MAGGAVRAAHRAKMAAERQDALREFVAVTGAEEDRARFFLESAGWDLQVAARGRMRQAGRGLRDAGVRRSTPVGAEAHRHPAGLRPDRGLRVPRPPATRRQLGLGVGVGGKRIGPGPASRALGIPLLLARPRGPRDFGHCGDLRGEGSLGAWRPRRGSAGGLAGGSGRVRRGAAVRPRWSFPSTPAARPLAEGEAQPGGRPTPPTPTYLREESTPGVVAQAWSLFECLSSSVRWQFLV